MIAHIAAARISVLARAVALQMEIKAARVDKQRVLALAAAAHCYLCKVIIAAARVAPGVAVGNANHNSAGCVDTPLRVAADNAVCHRKVAAAGMDTVAVVIAVNRAVIDGRRFAIADRLDTI